MISATPLRTGHQDRSVSQITITIMNLKYADDKLQKETRLAYAAFLCYRDDRDLKEAYNAFMQDNAEALTSMNAFLKWASTYDWQRRVNEYDAQQEMFEQREMRQLSRKNAYTAETIAEELYTCCMEELRLKQGEMTHKDIAKYMDICYKIGEKWEKPDVSPVTVNVEQKVEQKVETEKIDPETVAELGRLLALKASIPADAEVE